MRVPDRPYHSPLPADLSPWHVYVADSGHNLVVIPTSLWGTKDPDQLLIPVPVRAVLRAGHELRDGWLVSPVTVDPGLGYVAGPDEDEW